MSAKKHKFLTRQKLVLGALVLLWLAQAVFVVRGEYWGWSTVFREWQRPLAWRSARFYRGERFANETAFLRAHIPVNALVVLPPTTVDEALGRSVDMQWFLLPRKVTNCVEIACGTSWVQRGSAYVVFISNEFPGDQVPSDRLHLMGSSFGIVTPSAFSNESIFGNADVPSVPWRWLSEALAEMALLAIMYFGGAGLLYLLGSRASFTGWPVAAWALGSGALTFCTFLFLLAGVAVAPSALASMAILLALGWWGRQRRLETSLRWKWPSSWDGDFLAWGAFGLLVGWIGVLAVLSVVKGYHTTDAISIWGVKGYGIARLGLRRGTYLGLVRDYPLNIPLLIALPKALWGDAVGMSKLIFPLFLLGIVTVLYWETYRLSHNVLFSFLAGALWSTTPLIIHHAQMGYANLGTAFYVFSGLWLWYRHRQYLPAGLVLAWAVWSRPEAWLLVAGILAITGMTQTYRRNFWQVSLPPVVTFVFWVLVRRHAYAYRYAPGVMKTFSGGVLALFHGEVHWKTLWGVFAAWSRLFQPHLWGIAGVLILAGVLMGGWGWFKAKDGLKAIDAQLMVFVGVGMMGTISMIYYFTAYLPGYDLQWWLNTGFDRLLLPAVLTLWYAAWQFLWQYIKAVSTRV